MIDISVVMATYRRPHTISSALQSVLAQEGVNVEIIVVDDCPDGSAESVVRGLGHPEVRYLRNPKHSNGRPAVPRNLGWPLARGAILHFADDDDLVPQGYYADALDEFRRSPEIGLVFGNTTPFGEASTQLDSDQALFVRSARRAARLQRLGSRYPFTMSLLFLEIPFVGGCHAHAAPMRRSVR